MSHAKLSPSKSKQWLACTPSLKLEEQFPDSSGPGDAAQEGTLAHRLSEILISRQLGMMKQKEYEREVAKVKTSQYYDGAMQEHCEQYCAFVVEQFHALQVECPDAMIVLEEKFDLTEYMPEGFGTGDVTFIANRLLRVIDLKYGKGIKVDAADNSQAMIYGIGAYLSFGHMYEVTEVQMTIYQPRLDAIEDFHKTVPELMQWATDVLKPKARLAFDGEGEFSAGEHCKWCKAKPSCRAHADFMLNGAKDAFSEPELLTVEEIAELLGKVEMYKNWVTSVQEYAVEEAVSGRKVFPGYKIVRSKSSRKYTDEIKIREVLKEKGFATDSYLEVSLLPITKLEKSIGRGDFNTYLSEYIEKPLGALTLAPEADKRDVVDKNNDAANAFS